MTEYIPSFVDENILCIMYNIFIVHLMSPLCLNFRRLSLLFTRSGPEFGSLSCDPSLVDRRIVIPRLSAQFLPFLHDHY